jgi:hypothetical protein
VKFLAPPEHCPRMAVGTKYACCARCCVVEEEI